MVKNCSSMVPIVQMSVEQTSTYPFPSADALTIAGHAASSMPPRLGGAPLQGPATPHTITMASHGTAAFEAK